MRYFVSILVLAVLLAFLAPVHAAPAPSAPFDEDGIVTTNYSSTWDRAASITLVPEDSWEYGDIIVGGHLGLNGPPASDGSGIISTYRSTDGSMARITYGDMLPNMGFLP